MFPIPKGRPNAMITYFLPSAIVLCMLGHLSLGTYAGFTAHISKEFPYYVLDPSCCTRL